jgi:hypothetical protein
MVLQQIQHAKECWNAARYAESVRNSLCALHKCHAKVINALEQSLCEKYPILYKRHTIFNTEEPLEDQSEVFCGADHWVQKKDVIVLNLLDWQISHYRKV